MFGFEGSDSEAAAEGERILTEAVRLRMYADVPVGAFLSGGIDSSLVVALMQACANRPVKTFSIAFREEQFNEAPHAARVAEHLGTDHTEIMLTPDDALAVVPRLPEMFDEPFASPSNIPNFLLSQVARQDVTVTLLGSGGDEVFGGYNRYTYGDRVLRPISRLPRALRRLASIGIGMASPAAWNRVHRAATMVVPAASRQRLAGEKLHKIRKLMAFESPEEMYCSLVSAWQEPDELVVAGRECPSKLEEVLSAPDLGDQQVARAMLADQLTYLADDQLAMVDRASMAVSLEARVPILDHRVVEFAWRLRPDQKIRGDTGKWLLREVLYRRVPRELIERPKMGLSVPINSWLRGPLRSWAEDLLAPSVLTRDGILDPTQVQRAWRRFQAGKEHNGIGLWAVLMFQAWKERWLS
jgi:asparagine synthase (glutamine-hydrolysing)